MMLSRSQVGEIAFNQMGHLFWCGDRKGEEERDVCRQVCAFGWGNWRQFNKRSHHLRISEDCWGFSSGKFGEREKF